IHRYVPTFPTRRSSDLGLRRREDFAAQAGLMRLFAGIEQTLRTFDPAVYQSSPRSLAAATGDGEGLGLLERRRLRAQARTLWTRSEEHTSELQSRSDLV